MKMCLRTVGRRGLFCAVRGGNDAGIDQQVRSTHQLDHMRHNLEGVALGCSQSEVYSRER